MGNGLNKETLTTDHCESSSESVSAVNMDWNKDIDDTSILVNKTEVRTVYTNSRSLCNKIDEFEQTLAVEEADIVAVTETWFKTDQELMIPGFQGFYSSRKKCRGGGVAIIIYGQENVEQRRTYFFKLQSWLSFCHCQAKLTHEVSVYSCILSSTYSGIR